MELPYNKARVCPSAPEQKPFPPAMKTVDFAESYFPKEKERLKIPMIGVYLMLQMGALIACILGILKSRDIL